MPMAPEAYRDIVGLLGRECISEILGHYANATGVASGMVRWTDEMRQLAARPPEQLDNLDPDQYLPLRVTVVLNGSPLCKAIREHPRGNLHIGYSLDSSSHNR